MQPEAADPGHGRLGRRLDRVSHGERATDLAVPGDQDRGAALRVPLVALRRKGVGDLDTLVTQQPLASDDDLAACHDSPRAEAGQRLEAFHLRQRHLPPRLGPPR